MRLNFNKLDHGDRRYQKRCGCDVGDHCSCENRCSGGGPEDLVNKMSRNKTFFKIGHSWWEDGMEEVDYD